MWKLNIKSSFYDAYDKEWQPVSFESMDVDGTIGCFASGHCECCDGWHHGRAKSDEENTIIMSRDQKFESALFEFQESVLFLRKYRQQCGSYASVIRRRSARRQKRSSQSVGVVADTLNLLARNGPILLDDESLIKPGTKDVGLILDELYAFYDVFYTLMKAMPRLLTPDAMPALHKFIPNFADRAMFCLTLCRKARPFTDGYHLDDPEYVCMRADLDNLLVSSGPPRFATKDRDIQTFLDKYCK